MARSCPGCSWPCRPPRGAGAPGRRAGGSAGVRAGPAQGPAGEGLRLTLAFIGQHPPGDLPPAERSPAPNGAWAPALPARGRRTGGLPRPGPSSRPVGGADRQVTGPGWPAPGGIEPDRGPGYSVPAPAVPPPRHPGQSSPRRRDRRRRASCANRHRAPGRTLWGWTASDVHLMQSELLPGGARYTPVVTSRTGSGGTRRQPGGVAGGAGQARSGEPGECTSDGDRAGPGIDRGYLRPGPEGDGALRPGGGLGPIDFDLARQGQKDGVADRFTRSAPEPRARPPPSSSLCPPDRLRETLVAMIPHLGRGGGGLHPRRGPGAGDRSGHGGAAGERQLRRRPPHPLGTPHSGRAAGRGRPGAGRTLHRPPPPPLIRTPWPT